MKKATILKLVTIVMLIAVMISLSMQTSATAGNSNNTDTEWTFSVSIYGSIGYITQFGREKFNDSSVYIKCDSCSRGPMAKGDSFLATAYGSDNPNSGFINCEYNGKKSKTYTVKQGSVIYMINYIYETNHRYANVYAYAPYNANITLKGFWKPDSI